MGSFFHITVPTREYEILQRQEEHQIIINESFVDNNEDDGISFIARNDFGGSYASIPCIRIENEIPKRGNTFTPPISHSRSLADLTKLQEGPRSSLPTLSPLLRPNSETNIYEGIAEGKRVSIHVTPDTMEVLSTDGFQSINSKNMKPKHIQVEKLRLAIDRTFLEKHMEDGLKKFSIYDATRMASIDQNFIQVNFTVSADRSEEIINYMRTFGIGRKYKSTLSICPAVIHYNQNQGEKSREKLRDDSGQKIRFGTKFVKSIKSRLTVAQVIQSVQNNAVITFDFILLICIAGLIAGIGLLEDSSVCLVASMLISPLMGPIMAGCFGAVIRDWKLVKIGVISELVGLGICIIIGFIIGICVTWHPFDGPWADVKEWPTSEMTGRSKLRGMVVGMFIAIPSGAGVALSILGGNAGSLVGVAISASLLPPAVNAGLFWGMSAVTAIEDAINGYSISKGCSEIVGPPEDNESSTPENNLYCKNVLDEYALMGICSFGLTIMNIILILITGAIVLKIKEVAPHTTKRSLHRFWKEDLKAMRDYNIEHGGYDPQALFKEISNAENSAELRINLASDQVYNQVTRRTVYRTDADILQDSGLEDSGSSTSLITSTY